MPDDNVRGKPGALVIGIGNDFRCDDSIGLEVVRQLKGKCGADVTCLEQSGESASLLEIWSGYERVILVDAVQSGSPAGTIHRLDAIKQELPRSYFYHSTHLYSVAEAVELARTLGRLPGRLLLFGIEGEDFSSGETVTPEVLTAAATVVDEILAIVSA